MADVDEVEPETEEPAISQSRISAEKRRPAHSQLKATEEFKITIAVATVLTVLAQVGAVVLAVFVRHPSSECKAIIENLSSCSKFGFGAIVGLLGGSKR